MKIKLFEEFKIGKYQIGIKSDEEIGFEKNYKNLSNEIEEGIIDKNDEKANEKLKEYIGNYIIFYTTNPERKIGPSKLINYYFEMDDDTNKSVINLELENGHTYELNRYRRITTFFI